MQASFILMDDSSGGFRLWPRGSAVPGLEEMSETVSLVLIFGGSDLTRGADPASEGISWTTVSRILTWGGPDPACGAGCTSEWKSSRTAASLVETASRVLI